MEMQIAAYALYHFVLVSEERGWRGWCDGAKTPTRTHKEIRNGTEMNDNKVVNCKCVAIELREVRIRFFFFFKCVEIEFVFFWISHWRCIVNQSIFFLEPNLCLPEIISCSLLKMPGVIRHVYLFHISLIYPPINFSLSARGKAT